MDLSINVNDLTVGEIETIEDLIDASIDSIGDKGARKGKFLRAVALVVLRRDNPEATWEDAGNVRVAMPDTVRAEGNAPSVRPNRAERRARSRKHA